MNLSELIKKSIKFKCEQAYPSKKIKLTKIDKIPSILNLRKKYNTFRIQHNFINTEIPVILTDNGSCEVEIILNYNFFTYAEILSSVFGKHIPMSYETVGNVIHFNLLDEHLPYKYFIGKILYSKTGFTVINKLNSINSKFRNYDFEYIGGNVDVTDIKINEHRPNTTINDIVFSYSPSDIVIKTFAVANDEEKDNFLKLENFDKVLLNKLLNDYTNINSIIRINKLSTVVNENGIRLFVDLKNVYWCSKLQEERKKLLNEIKPNETVCDVFCGVGPMVIPLLKKNCIVYCNDLNSMAIKGLKTNLELNKLKANCFIYNLDAQEYLEKIKNIEIDHYILNLPEFSLDYVQFITRGTIHCYFFSTEHNLKSTLLQKIGTSDVSVRFIRKVSPKKNVYKLTLQK